MQSRLARFLENFILVAIILVLIQTFLEDFAVISGWNARLRNILVISGFVFDLLFTVEFLTRSLYAGSRKEFRRYFLEDRGWIDFLASIPLLLFNSGPQLFALITGTGAVLAFGSILNILKVVKAIRVARVLRLLRVLKIFRRIKNTDSNMTQRHIARISTMVVSTLVFTLLLFAVVESFVTTGNVEVLYRETTGSVGDYLESRELTETGNSAALKEYAESLPLLLMIKDDGHTRYSRYSNELYAEQWSAGDYGYISQGDTGLFIDISHLNVDNALINLRYFSIIVALVLMLMFVYSPHFALTVSDPIHIMRRGFDEPSYNLQVRIPGQFENDEIYRLAQLYNHHYLPMKDRERLDESSSLLDISLADFADFEPGEQESSAPLPGDEFPDSGMNLNLEESQSPDLEEPDLSLPDEEGLGELSLEDFSSQSADEFDADDLPDIPDLDDDMEFDIEDDSKDK